MNATKIIFFFFLTFLLKAEEPFWEYIGGPEEGFINDVVHNKENDNIYLSSNNGIFLTTNAGESWNRYFWDINTRTSSGIFLTANPDGLIFGYERNDNNKLYLSIDKGITKKYLVVSFQLSNPLDPKFDKNGNIYFLDSPLSGSEDTTTIYFSPDTGKTWHISKFYEYNSNGTHYRLPVLTYQDGILYLCTGTVDGEQSGLIRYTSDYGKTWIELKPPTICQSILRIGSIIVAGAFYGGYISYDNGKNWEKKFEFLSSINLSSDSTIYVSVRDINKESYVNKSNSLAQTWNILGKSLSSFHLKLNDGSIIGFKSSIYKSKDTCKSWQRSTTGLTGANIYGIAYGKDGSIYAVNWGVHKSTDKGESWQRIGMEKKDVREIAINQIGDLFVYTQNDDGIYRSTNDGKSWENYGLELMGGYPMDDIFINKRGYIYVGYEFSGYYISRDNGLTWTKEIPDGLSSHCFSVNSEGHIFRGDHAGIVSRSTDDGDSWEQMSEYFSGDNCFWDITSIAFDPKGCNGYALCLKTTDNGRNWKQFNSQDRKDHTPNAFDSLNNYLDIDFTNSKWEVFKSSDKGSNWVNINSGVEHNNLNFISVSPEGYYFLGAEYGGLYRSKQRYVSVEEKQILTDEITISPNPALDFIEISLDDVIPSKDGIQVRIFDLLGMELKGMDSRFRGNDNNAQGGGKVRVDVSRLVPGIYFVQIGNLVTKFVKI